MALVEYKIKLGVDGSVTGTPEILELDPGDRVRFRLDALPAVPAAKHGKGAKGRKAHANAAAPKVPIIVVDGGDTLSSMVNRRLVGPVLAASLTDEGGLRVQLGGKGRPGGDGGPSTAPPNLDDPPPEDPPPPAN